MRIGRGHGFECGLTVELTCGPATLTRDDKDIVTHCRLRPRGGRLKAIREMSKADPALVPGIKNMPGLGRRGSTKTVSRKAGYKQRKKRR